MNGPASYVFVTGSREYQGCVLEVPGLADWLERRRGRFHLIHGACRGFDTKVANYVEHALHGYATQLGIPMIGIAGQDRNQVLADFAAALASLGHTVEAYAFLQDGHPCVGTQGCIAKLRSHHIPVSVIRGNGRMHSDRRFAA